jgi:hypothetical protein
MHFVHEVGKGADIQTVKVPRGQKVLLDGEEFTVQGQAGGKVKIKNATGDRIVDEAAVTRPDVPQAVEPQVPRVADEGVYDPTAPKVEPEAPKDPVQAEVDRLKAEHEAYKARVETSPRSAEMKGKAIKGDAMKTAAEIRKVIQGESFEPVPGGLTDIELAAKVAREESNYVGKEVSVDGAPAKVVGTAFGKVKVQLEDGSVKTVEPDKIGKPQPKTAAPSPEDVKARLSRGNIVAPGDPEVITSLADLMAKKPGLYEALTPKQQAILKANLDGIGQTLEAPIVPKKGDTNQIKSGGAPSVKAYTPTHVSAAGNTLEVFGRNTEGNVVRHIIDDPTNPGHAYGFQDVPKPSKQVIPDAPVGKREAITPRAQTDAAIAQVKKLSEMAPNNRTIQNAAKILEKDNLTVKDVKRAQKALEDGSVTDAELKKMMEQFKQAEGTSNCG